MRAALASSHGATAPTKDTFRAVGLSKLSHPTRSALVVVALLTVSPSLFPERVSRAHVSATSSCAPVAQESRWSVSPCDDIEACSSFHPHFSTSLAPWALHSLAPTPLRLQPAVLAVQFPC
jgi:hypothetical protein